MTYDIESDLRALAAAAEWPSVDVDATVRARLAAGEGAPAARRRRWWAGLGALLAATGLLALPGPRAAIADWLGLDGVEIRTVGPSATTAPPRAPDDLGFGREVRVEDAAVALGRPPLLPQDLGPPQRAFLVAQYPTFAFGDLYLTEFVSGPGQPWVTKKLLPSAARVESVLVNGGPGFWIEGPHGVGFGSEPERTVGNVLLWEQDGLTLRLEGAGTREEALAVAGTIGR